MKTAKAVVAAGVAGLTALSTGLTDGRLTPTEVVVAVLAVLGAYGATWTVPNAAGTVTTAQLGREVLEERSRYSHTTYVGSVGIPKDADALPPGERPAVE